MIEHVDLHLVLIILKIQAHEELNVNNTCK